MPDGHLRVCSVCGAAAEQFEPGPAGTRQDARCPSCGSLERHRFLVQLLHAIVPQVLDEGYVLDAAPTRALNPTLRAMGGERTIRMDLNPRNRKVDLAADLTKLPIRTASVDVVVAYHVLEHIPDDLSAMHEIARILSAGGVAFIQVPWRPGPTDEDPDAPVEERIRRFGQHDHVRFYGDEFEVRLNDCGLRSRVVTPADLIPAWLIGQLRLLPDEKVWLCTRRDQPEPEALQQFREHWPDTAQQVIHVMAARNRAMREAREAHRGRVKSQRAELTKLRRANRRLRRQRNRWRRQYQNLRRRPIVKAALRVSRLTSRR